jgi:NAD(P)-dependent dehydrogenase (short-subunit alcohol dehydrogenase family)
MQTSMQEKTVFVTGATAGIGKETARALLGMGARVVIGARDEGKARAVVDELRTSTGNRQVEYLIADLLVQSDVWRLAETFKARYDRLDVLINNAGASFTRREITPDGIEKTWALNHLAGFLLTNLLTELLIISAPARVINVSSVAHRQGKIDFGDLNAERAFSGYPRYAMSKLANILHAKELARRLSDSGVTANALHPGFVPATFAPANRLLLALTRPIAQTIEEGAATSVFLASSSEVEGITGQYFASKRAVMPSRAAQDIETARRLWDVSLQSVSM